MISTLSQGVYIQPVIFPVSGLGTTIQPAGAYIDVAPYDCFGFLCAVGSNDRTAATIQVLQATAAAGTGSKVVSTAVNTTIAGASKYVIVEMATDQLDINNGFHYVAVQPTFTGGTNDVGTILFLAWRARILPVVQPTSAAQLVVL